MSPWYIFFKSAKHSSTVQIDWKASWQKIWTAFWVTAVVVFVSESSTWSSKDISEGSMVEHNSHKTGQLHRAITGLFYHLLLLQYYHLRTEDQPTWDQVQSFSPIEPRIIHQNISRICSLPGLPWSVNCSGALSNWWRKLSDYKKLGTITIRLTC